MARCPFRNPRRSCCSGSWAQANRASGGRLQHGWAARTRTATSSSSGPQGRLLVSCLPTRASQPCTVRNERTCWVSSAPFTAGCELSGPRRAWSTPPRSAPPSGRAAPESCGYGPGSTPWCAASRMPFRAVIGRATTTTSTRCSASRSASGPAGTNHWLTSRSTRNDADAATIAARLASDMTRDPTGGR